MAKYAFGGYAGLYVPLKFNLCHVAVSEVYVGIQHTVVFMVCLQ